MKQFKVYVLFEDFCYTLRSVNFALFVRKIESNVVVNVNPLMNFVAIWGTAVKHPVPDRVNL